MITQMQLTWLLGLIASGDTGRFYRSRKWARLRSQVIALDHKECQLCKAKGRYKKGTIVHHIKALKDRPDLALSIFDPDTGCRQLVTVCKDCHEKLHPEWQKQSAAGVDPVTAERWD